MTSSFSVLILTLNEQQNITTCLNSLTSCDDIVILDSYSRDKTIEIAETAGARIFQRKFDDYASQRNYGLSNIEYKHPWVLMVDADEFITHELLLEINNEIKYGSKSTTLYRLRRKEFFMGKWIRRSSGYPTWFGRLMKIGHVRVERAINEEYHTDGEVGILNEHLIHYPFNKGLDSWLEKHNRYSSMEAQLISVGGGGNAKWYNLFSKDPVIRRKVIKHYVYKLPGRPLLMFLALYFVKRGFLDGRAGITFCLLKSFYEFMITCKVKELKLRQNNKPL